LTHSGLPATSAFAAKHEQSLICVPSAASLARKNNFLALAPLCWVRDIVFPLRYFVTGRGLTSAQTNPGPLSLGGSLKTLGAHNPVDRSLAFASGGAVAWAAGVAAAYFLAALLGLALRIQPSDVAVFWPAAGVAAGILVVTGRRSYSALIIGVVVGTVAANLLSDRTLLTSLLKGLCNAGESILMAWLLEKWFGPQFAFGDIRRVVGFLAATGLAAAGSAIGGSAIMTLLHTTAPFADVWRDWFLSDGVGIVAVAPVVIGLGELWRQPPKWHESIEGSAALALLILTSMLVVSQPTASWASFSPGAAVLPLLLWLAARCPPAFVIGGAFFSSAAVICATSFGIGRFGDEVIPILQRAKGAQTAVMTVTVYTLALAALFATRSRGEQALKQSMKRLRLALDGAELRAFSANLGTMQLECDLRAAEMHGHNVPPTTIKESRRFIHPDDLVHMNAALATAKATGCAWTAEYRVVHPPNHAHSGETRWVALESSVERDSNGIPTGLIGVTRDITSQKLAHQALAERNLLLALAAKSARVGSFTLDAAADLMQVSDGYVAVHGLPEGTKQTTRTKWKARVHPEDLVRVEKMREQAFRQQRSEYSIEYRIVLPSGETRWVESRSFISSDHNGSPQRVVGVNIDITERKRAEEHQAILVAELDHRVKNTLAQVAVVAASTRQGSHSIDEFLQSLNGRIQSMAAAHTLLSKSGWQSVGLDALVRNQLAPYATDTNITISGTDIMLTAAEIQAIAKVLHELATNAAKHGALSIPGGRVSVNWDRQPNGDRDNLMLVWQELAGPPVKSEAQASYGTNLIRNLIPHELGGKVDLMFAPDGVNCRMEFPLKR
jgi:PAS domain S-box-containing protein